MTVRSGLSEARRLDLICEAIWYCQRVRDKGMPNLAWTKALREPIHFLWEKRGETSSRPPATGRSPLRASPGASARSATTMPCRSGPCRRSSWRWPTPQRTR